MSTTPTGVEERLEQLQNLGRKERAGIMDQAVCVRVELRRPGTTRKVRKQVNIPDAQHTLIPGDEKMRAVSLINSEITTDLELLRVSKEVMDAPEMTAIQKHDNGIRRFMMTKALPSIFQAGVYLIPDALISEIDHVLQNFQNTRAELVTALMAALPRIREDSKKRLDNLAEDTDILSDEKMRAAFSMRFEYISYGVNEKLKKINHDLFEREREKSEIRFAEAEEQIKNGLRAALSGLIDHAVGRFTGSADGKRKMFRKDTLDSLKEFMDNFSSRNICNDEELAALVKQAQNICDGVDVKDIRDNEAVRDNMQRGFEEVKTQLDTMLVNAPVRMIIMDDEEGA